MIDKNKTYRTEDGLEVRIYATDVGGEYPIHGAIYLNGRWEFNRWTSDGSFYEPSVFHVMDLVEVKPRIQREIWLSIYPEGDAHIGYDTKAEADRWRDPNALATVKVVIDCEEGEGL